MAVAGTTRRAIAAPPTATRTSHPTATATWACAPQLPPVWRDQKHFLSAEASARDWAERPRADGSDNPDWQLYAIRPAEIEFWQGSNDGNHIRHRFGPNGVLPG